MPADAKLRLWTEFEEAITSGLFSGASLLISGGVEPDLEDTWGTVESGGVPVSPSTCFDLASLTKPLVTAPLCMVAVSRSLISLEDTLPRFFPGLVPKDKEGISIRNLLSHSSGFPAYERFYQGLIGVPAQDRQSALVSMILKTPLDAAPGKKAQYSDIGFILLGLILERRMGAGLDRLARDFLFDPLGIDDLHYCRLDARTSDPGQMRDDNGWTADDQDAPGRRRGDAQSVAPASQSPRVLASVAYAATELCPWRKRLLRGEVDDKNAWILNGVAGHAGLFGTASGVFKLISSLWNIYEGNVSNRFLPREIVRLFWTRTEDAEGSSEWCMGYDTPSRNGYTSTGRYFSDDTIGHLGFTGVSFWLDLDKRVMVILLTNRVYPTRQNNAIRLLRPVLHDIIMENLVMEDGGKITENGGKKAE